MVSIRINGKTHMTKAVAILAVIIIINTRNDVLVTLDMIC